MNEVRKATDQEWIELLEMERGEYAPLGGWVLEIEGERIGWVFASIIQGRAWLHDLKVEGNQAMGAALLILKAKRELKAMGVEEWTVMVENGSIIHQFYLDHGFKEYKVVLTGRIN